MALENFTVWNPGELDPDGDITVTANRIRAVDLENDNDGRVANDEGVGQIDAIHDRVKVTLQGGNESTAVQAAVWAVTNVLDDMEYWDTNDSEAVGLKVFHSTGSSKWFLRLENFETDGVGSGAHELCADGGAPVSRWVDVYRAAGSATLTVTIYSDAYSTQLEQISVTDLNTSRTYRYRGTFNADRGNSGDTISFDIENWDTHPEPYAPTALTASDGTVADAVRLNWTKGVDATGNKVYRNTEDVSGGAVLIDTIGDVVTHDDTTAEPGTVYWYWLKATNAAGDSAFSGSDSGYIEAVAGTARKIALGIL